MHAYKILAFSEALDAPEDSCTHVAVPVEVEPHSDVFNEYESQAVWALGLPQGAEVFSRTVALMTAEEYRTAVQQ